jgi:YD repeat-containing protein
MSRSTWQKQGLAAAGLLVGLVVLPSEADSSSDFTYDLVGRVTTALYDNGSCIAYGYDANSNRAFQTNTIAGAPESPTWGSGVLGCFKWTPQ